MGIITSQSVTLRESSSEYLLSIHASLKERAKKIEPHKWDGTRRCWVYPHLPQIYLAIKAEFGTELVDETSQYATPETSAITVLNDEIARIRAENDGRLQLLTSFQSENAALQQKVAEAAARVQLLETAMERQLTEKDRKLRELQVGYNTLQMQVVELNERLWKAGQSSTLSQRVTELEQLNATLAAKVREAERLEDSAKCTTQFQEELAEKEHVLSDLRRDIANLKRKLALKTKKGTLAEMQPHLERLPFPKVECLVLQLLVTAGLDAASVSTVKRYENIVLLSGLWNYRQTVPCDVLIYITSQAGPILVDALKQIVADNSTVKRIFVVAPRGTSSHAIKQTALSDNVQVCCVDQIGLLKLFLRYGIGCRRDWQDLILFDQARWLCDVNSASNAYFGLLSASGDAPKQAMTAGGAVFGPPVTRQPTPSQYVPPQQPQGGQQYHLPLFARGEVRRNAADLLDTAREDADQGVVLHSSWLGKDEQGRMSSKDWSHWFDEFDSLDWEEHFASAEYGDQC